MKKLVVLNAGLSTPSTTRLLAERIAGSVEAQVSKRGEGLEVEYVDIRDLATDLATVMVTGIPSVALQKVQDSVSAADALVAVTPVFSASYSGLFKMFIDALDTDSLNDMPVIIAATAGTARHALVLDYALRPLFTYLRAIVIPTGIFAATEDFGKESDLTSRIARAAAQLASHIVAENGAVEGFGPDFSIESSASSSRRDGSRPRTSGTRVSKEVIDFSDLLKGHEG